MMRPPYRGVAMAAGLAAAMPAADHRPQAVIWMMKFRSKIFDIRKSYGGRFGPRFHALHKI